MSKPDVLYLVHRMPYPPDKGDKIRSYHILQYLLKHYRVHLGCFVDTIEDLQHVDSLRQDCASIFAPRLRPLFARILSATGFLTGGSLSVPYYRSRAMRRWVRKTLENNTIQAAVVFSSPMAQYLPGELPFPRVMDFVDVDSDKWSQYSETKTGLSRWLYTREASKLLTYERQVAREFDASVFVSPNETSLFSEIAPESCHKHHAICNGVAYDYFDPTIKLSNPFSDGIEALVFTGMMDYWPNVDAVSWFAKDVFPRIRSQRPKSEFWVVGGAPTPEVLELRKLPGVNVTGRVPDVRPFLRYANTVVAPLRIARGVQNKVLEALSMGKIVVCTPEAAAGLDNLPEEAAIVSGEQDSFASLVIDCLGQDKRSAHSVARNYVIHNYDWDRNLALLGALLAKSTSNE